MSYYDDLCKDKNYQREKAIQISRDLQSSIDLFFAMETDYGHIKNLINELNAIVEYTDNCILPTLKSLKGTKDDIR